MRFKEAAKDPSADKFSNDEGSICGKTEQEELELASSWVRNYSWRAFLDLGRNVEIEEARLFFLEWVVWWEDGKESSSSSSSRTVVR